MKINFWTIVLVTKLYILCEQLYMCKKGDPFRQESFDYIIYWGYFSPDGKYLATADSQGMLRIWDVYPYGQPILYASKNMSVPIHKARYTKDGLYIAILEFSSQITILHFPNLTYYLVFNNSLSDDTVNFIDFNIDSDLMITGSYDNSYRILKFPSLDIIASNTSYFPYSPKKVYFKQSSNEYYIFTIRNIYYHYTNHTLISMQQDTNDDWNDLQRCNYSSLVMLVFNKTISQTRVNASDWHGYLDSNFSDFHSIFTTENCSIRGLAGNMLSFYTYDYQHLLTYNFVEGGKVMSIAFYKNTNNAIAVYYKGYIQKYQTCCPAYKHHFNCSRIYCTFFGEETSVCKKEIDHAFDGCYYNCYVEYNFSCWLETGYMYSFCSYTLPLYMNLTSIYLDENSFTLIIEINPPLHALGVLYGSHLKDVFSFNDSNCKIEYIEFNKETGHLTINSAISSRIYYLSLTFIGNNLKELSLIPESTLYIDDQYLPIPFIYKSMLEAMLEVLVILAGVFGWIAYAFGAITLQPGGIYSMFLLNFIWILASTTKSYTYYKYFNSIRALKYIVTAHPYVSNTNKIYDDSQEFTVYYRMFGISTNKFINNFNPIFYVQIAIFILFCVCLLIKKVCQMKGTPPQIQKIKKIHLIICQISLYVTLLNIQYLTFLICVFFSKANYKDTSSIILLLVSFLSSMVLIGYSYVHPTYVPHFTFKTFKPNSISQLYCPIFISCCLCTTIIMVLCPQKLASISMPIFLALLSLYLLPYMKVPQNVRLMLTILGIAAVIGGQGGQGGLLGVVIVGVGVAAGSFGLQVLGFVSKRKEKKEMLLRKNQQGEKYMWKILQDLSVANVCDINKRLPSDNTFKSYLRKKYNIYKISNYLKSSINSMKEEFSIHKNEKKLLLYPFDSLPSGYKRYARLNDGLNCPDYDNILESYEISYRPNMYYYRENIYKYNGKTNLHPQKYNLERVLHSYNDFINFQYSKYKTHYMITNKNEDTDTFTQIYNYI